MKPCAAHVGPFRKGGGAKTQIMDGEEKVTEVVKNAQKNSAGERTLKMSSDQGEARSGPVCQVPGFPGCQDDCPLGSWLPGPWVP